jgi:hypothetical protein
MTKQFSIAQLVLWLFIVSLGIEIGAGLYEIFVIVPLWAGSAPDSTIAFYQHNAANPHLAINAGGRFWIFASPLLSLLSIATLLSGRRTNSEHRRWRMAAGGIVFLIMCTTFGWFVPNILMLQSKEVLTMNPDTVRSVANWWASLNWLRAFLAIVAWLFALRALSIGSENIAD